MPVPIPDPRAPRADAASWERYVKECRARAEHARGNGRAGYAAECERNAAHAERMAREDSARSARPPAPRQDRSR